MPNTLLKKIKIFTGGVGSTSPPGGGTTVGVIGSGTLNYVTKFTPNGTSVGNSILFDDGTNIGLGLTSLTAKLHIQGIDSTSLNYALKVDNSSNTPLLYVRNDGNVGIGVVSPNARLSFGAYAGDNDGIIKILDNGGTDFYGFGVSIANGLTYSSGLGHTFKFGAFNKFIAKATFGMNTNDNVDVMLSLKSETTTSAKWNLISYDSANNSLFCINNDGNIGIGNNPTSGTPTARFYVKSASSTSANYALKVDNSAGTPLLYVRNDGFTTIMDMIVGRGGGLSQYNTALGVNALFNNTTANRLVAIGWNTLSQNTTGFANTGIGYNSLSLNNGSNNTAVGSDAMSNNASGVGNVGIGVAALSSNQTGSNNVVISANSGGQGALSSNISGSRNIAIGMYCAYNQTNLDETIAIGSAALYTNISGSGNVAFGNNALRLNTLGGNLAIGNSAGKNQTVASNMFFIDNQDRGSAANELINSLIVGNFAATLAGQTLRFNANVGFNGTSFGGGVGVLFKGFASTTPTTNPIGGVIDYVENTGSGVQKYRDINGTIIAY